jgi:hypothetical protein
MESNRQSESRILGDVIRVYLLPLLAALAAPASAHSYYPVRLDDPKAVYLTSGNFPVHADGVADDTGALQAAIDKAQETGGEGIVFDPQADIG